MNNSVIGLDIAKNIFHLFTLLEVIESPEGTSPSGSHRTVLETLASHGSSCPLLTPWPASLHNPLVPPISG